MTTAASRRAVAEAAAKQILNATERPRKRLANAFGTAIDGRHPRSAHQRGLIFIICSCYDSCMFDYLGMYS